MALGYDGIWTNVTSNCLGAHEKLDSLRPRDTLYLPLYYMICAAYLGYPAEGAAQAPQTHNLVASQPAADYFECLII